MASTTKGKRSANQKQKDTSTKREVPSTSGVINAVLANNSITCSRTTSPMNSLPMQENESKWVQQVKDITAQLLRILLKVLEV